jgi:hypothetical protein
MFSSWSVYVLKLLHLRGKTRAGNFRLAVGWFPRKRYGGIMKITEEGRREHHVGNAACPACDSPDGQHWPQPHRDGIVIKNCLGLVHYEEVPTPGSRGASSVVYRCDLCGDSI